MPKLGVDMQEGEIIEWKKQEGDVVNEGDILLEIMSDKTNMELEAEDSGVLLKITRQAGETVPVTEVIGYIGAEGEVVADNAASAPVAAAAPQVEEVAVVETPAATPQPQVAVVHEGGKVRATPKARKVARELGIDLAQVLGTGPKGRVHADDVENFKGAQPKVTPLARKIAADLGIDLATVLEQALVVRLLRKMSLQSVLQHKLRKLLLHLRLKLNLKKSCQKVWKSFQCLLCVRRFLRE